MRELKETSIVGTELPKGEEKMRSSFLFLILLMVSCGSAEYSVLVPLAPSDKCLDTKIVVDANDGTIVFDQVNSEKVIDCPSPAQQLVISNEEAAKIMRDIVRKYSKCEK